MAVAMGSLSTLLLLFFSMLSGGARACFLPVSIQVFVPEIIHRGYVVAPVHVDNCDYETLTLTSSDQHFTVGREGITALSTLAVTTTGRIFYVWAQDARGHKSEMEVVILHRPGAIMKELVPDQTRFLKRSKRRWSPPPFIIIENDVPPFPKEIDRIGSDSAAVYNVYYTIDGPGVTEHPVRVLSVDRNSGMLSVHRSIDREEFPEIEFTAHVFDRGTNKETDLPLKVKVIVTDVNDNSPEFKDPLLFTVLEKSKAGTVVGKVNATDRDQANTPHTKIKYSLLSGTTLFNINPDSGVITTVNNQLDREAYDTYLISVQIKDMGGAATGLSNTARATVILGDINDNPPTFTKTSFEASVDENKMEQLLLRIPVEDKDKINTENWNSKFVITEGNEKGYFRMDRDPETNEGLLYLAKPLDYETTKNLKLSITAQNQAKLAGTTASWVTVPVNVAVRDVDEGPEFTAPTVRFNVQENTPNGTVIGSYTAADPETKSSDGIKYYKISDPASWINVDVNSGVLKVANTIDRESSFVRDGIYNVSMKAVDSSSKTGTGMVIIAVEDANDHVPELPPGEMVICERDDARGSVVIVAADQDQSPYAAPFSFTLPEKHDGKWTLKLFNDTAATLEHTKELPVGMYTVPVVVKDLQGSGEVQTVKVRICQCSRNGACLDKDTSSSLGPLGILALLLPLFLLLLLCVLLAFFCATKPEKRQAEDVGDSGGMLLKSNIEVPGDEVKDMNLILGPGFGMEQDKGSVKGSLQNAGIAGLNMSSTLLGGCSVLDNRQSLSRGFTQNGFSQTRYFEDGQFVNSNMAVNSGQLSNDSSFLHNWQTNGRYLQQKLAYMGTEAEARYAEDIVHSYGYEGAGSAAGSVGCCSDQGNQENLDFLNTLGPKFRTLADVCAKK